MSERHEVILSGVILDETTTLTLSEISRACNVHAELIMEMTLQGLLEPISSIQPWQFKSDVLVRAQRAVKLQRDLELNIASLALVLDLLDEVEQLRAEISLLRHQL